MSELPGISCKQTKIWDIILVYYTFGVASGINSWKTLQNKCFVWFTFNKLVNMFDDGVINDGIIFQINFFNWVDERNCWNYQIFTHISLNYMKKHLFTIRKNSFLFFLWHFVGKNIAWEVCWRMLNVRGR